MQQCTQCSASKPLDQYYDQVKWQGGKHTWCKECMAYDRWVRRLLAASHPKEENQACYLCGATDRRLEIEHCHERALQEPRESFRGFSCHSCNIKQRRTSNATPPRVEPRVVIS